MTRGALGRPGSLRRWLIGSLGLLLLCAVLFIYSGFLARIFIFIFAAAVVTSAFRARSLVIGDEDEVRAWLRDGSAHTPYVRDDEADGSLPEEWEALVRRRENPLSDVPPAPILERQTRTDTQSSRHDEVEMRSPSE